MAEKLLFFSAQLTGNYTRVKVVWLKIKYGLVLFIAQNRIIVEVVFGIITVSVESLTCIFVI